MSASPAFVWTIGVRDSSLPWRVKAVCLVMATYMNADGTNAHPGFKLLASITQQSERTVQRAVEAAVSAGWLIRTQRGGRRGDGSTYSSVYAAAIPQPDIPVVLSEVSTGHDDVVLSEVSTRQTTPLNTTNDPSQHDTAVSDHQSLFTSPNAPVLELWQEKCKAALTDHDRTLDTDDIALLLESVADSEHPVIDIDHLIARGWIRSVLADLRAQRLAGVS